MATTRSPQQYKKKVEEALRLITKILTRIGGFRCISESPEYNDGLSGGEGWNIRVLGISKLEPQGDETSRELVITRKGNLMLRVHIQHSPYCSTARVIPLPDDFWELHVNNSKAYNNIFLVDLQIVLGRELDAITVWLSRAQRESQDFYNSLCSCG